MHGLLLKYLLLTTVHRYSVAPVSSLVCFHPKENSFIPRLPPITLCDPNTGEEPGNEVARLLTTIRFVIPCMQYREKFTQMDFIPSQLVYIIFFSSTVQHFNFSAHFLSTCYSVYSACVLIKWCISALILHDSQLFT